MRNITVLLLACGAAWAAEPAESRWAWRGARLMYGTAAEGDRLPDFSAVGYGRGAALPDVAGPVVRVAPPGSGDAGAAIQAALDTVAASEPDERGFRGVVELAAGEYRIDGQIRIRAGGTVLRGAGDGEGGTLLRATGKSDRALILVDPGTGSLRKLAGTERKIADKYVPVGAASLRVESAEGFQAGDRVVVFRPSTAEWIRDLGMDRIPGDSSIVQWTPGSKDLRYERTILRVEGDRIFLDAPVCNSFDRRYGGGSVYKYEFPRIREVGIEDIAGDSDYTSPTDEEHAWDFIKIDRAEEAWVRRVTARHFAYAAVNLGENAKFVTVEDTACLDPISQITGGRRYSFNVDGQMCLVRRVRARNGRHDFVQGSLTYGPNVFLRSRAERANDESGPHHRWSTGTLFDNIVVEGNYLAAWNRGASGTGHGWSGANIVFWNCEARGFRVQNPVTAQNWVIGGLGQTVKPNDFMNGALGIFDAHGAHVAVESLYEAQFEERQARAALREYVLGDYDGFADDGPEDDVFADEGWVEEVRRMGVAAPRFDAAEGGFVPFTFRFGLEEGEQVAGATLTVSMRGSGSLWLGSTDEERRVAVDRPVVVLDVPAELLAGGLLNVAAGPGAAVDWARLDLTIAQP